MIPLNFGRPTVITVTEGTVFLAAQFARNCACVSERPSLSTFTFTLYTAQGCPLLTYPAFDYAEDGAVKFRLDNRVLQLQRRRYVGVFRDGCIECGKVYVQPGDTCSLVKAYAVTPVAQCGPDPCEAACG